MLIASSSAPVARSIVSSVTPVTATPPPQIAASKAMLAKTMRSPGVVAVAPACAAIDAAARTAQQLRDRSNLRVAARCRQDRFAGRGGGQDQRRAGRADARSDARHRKPPA